MAMSDCPKCWETPCKCGYEYQYYSDEELVDFITSILKYHSNKLDILEKAKKIIENSK